MGAPLWFRMGVGGLSRVSPGRAAALANAFFRKPSLTQGLSEADKARLAQAEDLMRHGRVDDHDVGGRVLRSYHFPVQGPSRGLVLLLHGWSGDARAMAAFLPDLAAAGYEALAIDLPAHGGSDGSETDAEEAATLIAGLLRMRKIAPDHVIAHSYGGAVTGLLAERGVAPRGFVSIAAPADFSLIIDEMQVVFALSPTARRKFEAMTEAQLRRPIDSLDATKIWKDLRTDILILHSVCDQRVSFAHAEHFSKTGARLSPVEALDHCEIVYHPSTVASALAHLQMVDCAEQAPQRLQAA